MTHASMAYQSIKGLHKTGSKTPDQMTFEILVKNESMPHRAETTIENTRYCKPKRITLDVNKILGPPPLQDFYEKSRYSSLVDDATATMT
jgi:hypothetical protein